jgi:hypothetical protein
MTTSGRAAPTPNGPRQSSDQSIRPSRDRGAARSRARTGSIGRTTRGAPSGGPTGTRRVGRPSRMPARATTFRSEAPRTNARLTLHSPSNSQACDSQPDADSVQGRAGRVPADDAVRQRAEGRRRARAITTPWASALVTRQTIYSPSESAVVSGPQSPASPPMKRTSGHPPWPEGHRQTCPLPLAILTYAVERSALQVGGEASGSR